MITELFIVFSFAILVATIEFSWWEVWVKKAAKVLFPMIGKFDTYWLVHPLLVFIPVYIISHSLLITLGCWMLYGVVEDIIYFSLCYLKGSTTSYANQDWMDVFNVFGFRLPKFYITNLIIASVSLLI